MKKLLFLSLLSSCAVIDSLDARVEDPDDCCLVIGHERRQECVFNATEDFQIGCWIVECSFGGRIEACRSASPEE